MFRELGADQVYMYLCVISTTNYSDNTYRKKKNVQYFF